MSAWLSVGASLVAASAVAAVCIALLLSLPVVGLRALQVVARREWLPMTYSMRSLLRRKSTIASTFAGLALVVFVLTGVMMLAQGVAHTLASTGGALNVKVLHQNAGSEWSSWLNERDMQLVRAAPGIAKDEAGNLLVSGEMVALVWAPHGQGTDPDDGANLTVRGVHPAAFAVHPAQVRAGRLFLPGTNEVVIGKALEGRFDGAQLGGSMSFADRKWTVAGIVDHGGSAYDSEIWGDIEVLGPTFHRGYSTVTLALADHGGLDALSQALASGSEQSKLLAKRERSYWQALSRNYVEFVRLVGAFVGIIFSFGAVLGALNTMYAQVTARTRELGTLRAIGFKPRAILVSLVLESVLLSLAAGVVGVLAAALLSQVAFRSSALETLSEISYRFHLSLPLALASLAFAAAMGYAGGLLPALRAARMSIVNAVRAD